LGGSYIHVAEDEAKSATVASIMDNDTLCGTGISGRDSGKMRVLERISVSSMGCKLSDMRKKKGDATEGY
jgi:hypothetical protein